MQKVTQRTIRGLIEDGQAVDITKWPFDDVRELGRHSEVIMYSLGTYGPNGVVVMAEDGNLYACPCRNNVTAQLI